MSEPHPALMPMLELAVPIWQDQLRGAPWETLSERAGECSQYLAEHGDDLMFGGKHSGEAFNRLAEGLAIGSMMPGGVTFNGAHYEA